ncbi:MAG: hypothetical protein HZR80_16670 [Candidatus Heimdallarchaeota archaeon]
MYYHRTGNFPKKILASPNDNLNYLLRCETDQQINFIFQLDGQVDAERMKKAVRLTLDAEPVLGCRFVKDRRKTYWERRDDIDGLNYFEVIETTKVENELNKFILSQIDPSLDSIIQVKIFRSEKDTLMIKSDHSVMDGGGFYDYLTLLCDIYNKLTENPSYNVQPNIQASRGLKQV